jgi:two-component system, NtrC family, response regulator AtoC
VSDDRVLIIDDEPDVARSVQRALSGAAPRLTIDVECRAERALDRVKDRDPSVVILDLTLDKGVGPESGLSLLDQIGRAAPMSRVIVLTGNSSNEFGVRAMQGGAMSFLAKPADIPHLNALVREGIHQSNLRRSMEWLRGRTAAFGELVGEADSIRRVRAQIHQAASHQLPVLLTGETGTGKGICARAIHRLSSRSAGAFVRYQPNFGNADMAASELFGHVRGAFTGASDHRTGFLEQASGGTLFLDEACELPVSLQVQLLEVLQERVFRAVGDIKERSSDFRLISAFNRPVSEVLEEGTLRRDLFHRLAYVHIHLPPLRERKDDLEPIVRDILRRIEERERLPPMTLSAAALTKCRDYSWPGNVRELQGVIERAACSVHLEARSTIDSADLTFLEAFAQPDHVRVREATLPNELEQLRRVRARDALHRAGGNKSRAAQELGIDRKTLRRLVSSPTE